jgi:iron-sulfur cluster repair protein YtfE (RIC family)
LKITDGLLGEHALFYPLFDRAAALVAESGTLTEVIQVLALLTPAILSHAEIEDELLFPELERAGIGEMPVRVMRSEHEDIDALIQRVRRARAHAEARETFLELLELLEDHFRKEETVLFPMSRKLGDDTLERLGCEWERRRGLRR